MWLPNVASVFIGFFVGVLLFSRVGHLVAALREITIDPSGSPKAGRLMIATVLSSGSWFLVITIFLAYYVRTEAWAPWLYGGALLALALFGALSIALAYGIRLPSVSMPRALNPLRAEHSDKPIFLRTWGVVMAVLNIATLGVLFQKPFDPGVIIITAVISYFGGKLMGWFFWGLFFEPAVGMRSRKDVMPNSMLHRDARETAGDTQNSPPRAPGEHGR